MSSNEQSSGSLFSSDSTSSLAVLMDKLVSEAGSFSLLTGTVILRSARCNYQEGIWQETQDERIIGSVLNAGVLTFKEFVMREPLPLATIHEAVLEFLRGRDDVVVFGATAVNAYVSEPRMTQDIDLMSTRAPELADELRAYLSERFHIAVRVREVRGGKGYRLFQMQKSGNRRLVDVHTVKSLPNSQTVEDIQVLTPPELIASKVCSYHSRQGQPKGGTDWRDIAML